MAYVQNQTNVRNVLADFIMTICFNKNAVEKAENWELLCPVIQKSGNLVSEDQKEYTVFNKEDAYDWILNNRRATVASTFMPSNEWQYNEVFKVTQEYLNRFPNETYIQEEITVTRNELKTYNEIVKISLKRRIEYSEETEFYIDEIINSDLSSLEFAYNNDYNTLGLLEFYIDIEKREIHILKDNFTLNDDEKFTLHIKYRTPPTFEIPILKTMYNINAIKLKVKGHKGVFYTNTELESLNIMEFYPDVKYKKLVLLKDTINLKENYEITFLTSYQTYATNPVTWYVEFLYPKNIDSSTPNYNYFEWTFGNTLDFNNYKILPNKGVNSPIFRCFWHTTNKLKTPSADWLPIEYFISWDDSAISFVFCEDPIGDLNITMHPFSYIGVLENIENAENDDILSNFGSCGSYDIAITTPSGTADGGTTSKAKITFIETIYDSYFEEKEKRALFKLNNTQYGNYTIGSHMIDDANLISEETIQYVVGDPANPYFEPSPISNVFNDQPIKRYNILRKSSNEYIIEFQYRDPFRGEMHYDFPTKWFDNSIRPKDFNDLNGNSLLLLPIVEENMLVDSNFKNVEEIDNVFNDEMRGKEPVLKRLSFDRINNNDTHKNTVITPEIITNVKTGESWFLEGVKVIDGIEKTENSITNICMYPRQSYIGNFCYSKRTMNICTVSLEGEVDSDKMKLVLINSDSKVLVDFSGIQTYKNISIRRNSDNGVTLDVDFNNLNNEIIYLGMYKNDNYLKNYIEAKDTIPAVSGGWLPLDENTKNQMISLNIIPQSGCGNPMEPWKCLGHINTYLSKGGILPEKIIGSPSQPAITGKFEIYPINIKVKFIGDELITNLVSHIHSWTFPYSAQIPSNRDHFPSIPINDALIPDKDFSSNFFRLVEINLGDKNKTFIPNIVINQDNITNNWT